MGGFVQEGRLRRPRALEIGGRLRYAGSQMWQESRDALGAGPRQGRELWPLVGGSGCEVGNRGNDSEDGKVRSYN